MLYYIQKENTRDPIEFLLTDSVTHVNPALGLTPVVTISKAGGAFVPAQGAVSEIGNGVYKIAPNANDADTLGWLWVHVTAPGADPADFVYAVVNYDPIESLGLVASKVLAISGRVTYSGPVAPAGTVTLRKGDAYLSARGSSLQWSSTGWPDLTGATLELVDMSDGSNLGATSFTVNDDTQTVTVEITSEASAVIEAGQREYLLTATWAGERVELTDGTLVVLEG